MELSTKLHSESLVWKEMGAGRITSSTAHVLHAKNNELPKSAILKICTIAPELNLPLLIWGTQHESTALQCYFNQIKGNLTDLNVTTRSLKLHEEFHILGASADGIATCKCHGTFLVEIKCPHKYRDADSLLECIKDPDFCVATSIE